MGWLVFKKFLIWGGVREDWNSTFEIAPFTPFNQHFHISALRLLWHRNYFSWRWKWGFFSRTFFSTLHKESYTHTTSMSNSTLSSCHFLCNVKISRQSFFTFFATQQQQQCEGEFLRLLLFRLRWAGFGWHVVFCWGIQMEVINFNSVFVCVAFFSLCDF